METRATVGEPFGGHTDGATSVAFSPSGKVLAAGSWDNTILLWDVESHQPIGGPLDAEKGSVIDLAFSPDGKLLAAAMGDQVIALWNMEGVPGVSP
jgi:WD40 repeat protein